ncbi:MAG TPA: DUF4189 domain-containing protein [Burkholderiaceae bacterium]|jgi:hypothetical protein|nr:DUF4189 domain-containing protein [Burkholderiaceae bacterium]
MKRITFTLLALLLSAGAHAAGAIAVDDDEGEDEPGYGFVTGAANRDEAGRKALQECRKSGNDNCKVVARFDTCGAYAASKKYYGVGWGNTKAKAIDMALENCRGKCKVHVAECE